MITKYLPIATRPVFRPMVFEFPDAATNDSDDIDGGEGIHLASQRQFMFGNAILVLPVLEAAASIVDVYFPRGSWYELWSGLGLNYQEEVSRWQKIEALLYQIPSYIRGGTIVPMLVSMTIFNIIV